MVKTVHIKKIVIRGFKSFGNRKVTVNFSKGFVVVVGPNGSGKSNLLDAIRFGIGMLSAKSMRAGSFSDLIFYSKSGGGKAAKYASVSIYLDNTDRRIPVDSDTVIITRQIDLDGRGIYKLNGRTVSRSHIVDLLEAAGISPDGYNMVPQGEILEIICKGPIEIRRLFEDIAGIASFDEKKEKAQKELEVAEQNLRENLAQVREVKSLVERLANERESALKYKQLEEEVSRLKAKLCLAQLKREIEKLERVDEEINKKSERIKTLRENIENIQRKRQEILEKAKILEAEGSGLKRELEEIILNLNEKRRLVSERKVIVSFKENELAQKMEQASLLEAEIEKIKSRLEAEKGELGKTLMEHEKLRKAIEEKQRVLEALYKHASNIDSEYIKVKEELDSLKSELDELKHEEARLESERKLIEKELSHYQATISTKKEKLRKLRDIIERLKKEVMLLRNEKEKAEERERRLSDELKSADSEEERRRRELDEVGKIIQKLREEIVRIRAINEERNRILRSQSAVHEILKLRDSNAIKGIYGTIAELGSTREEYAVALEAAAGQRLNYIVVENDEVAVECIKFLKENRLGRATFIPLNLVRPKPKPNINGEGIIGRAVDLIDFDEKFRPAFEYVFGNTIIVENLDVARRLHNAKVRKVSLDGEILETSGVMVGGYIQRRQAVFLQELEELPKLENELKGVEEIRKMLVLGIENLNSQKKKTTYELKQVEKEIHICEARIKELEGKISSLEKDAREDEEEIKEQEKAIGEKEGELYKIVNLLSEVRYRISTTSESITRLEEVISSSKTSILQAQIRELEKELLTLREELNKLDVKIAEKQTLIEEHLLRTLRDKEKSLSLILEEKNKVESDLERVRGELREKMSEASLLERRKDEIEGKLTEIKRETEKIRQEDANLSSLLEKLSSEVRELEVELRGAEVEKSFIKETLSKLESEAKEYEGQLFEDLETVDFKELEEAIRAKEKEKKKLEPVNMLAIELYEKERKRYEELIEKRNKLIEERESILNFIREVEKDKRSTFLSTFYAIEGNFKQIFSILSPGGNARFVLENPLDPFSSGVIIEASPAGKEVKRLELMSGGEKSLTSLALIFAIQQYHPAPFYIMDEIDAFLDEQNASRVAELIKELSKTSQFIVVSLRKATMRKADQIIGVTYMNGTSHIFSFETNLKQTGHFGGEEVAA